MSSKYNPLLGKKVVVIGGTSGMGYGAAEISSDRGAIVFVGSSAPSKVQAAVAKLQKAYPSGTVYGRAVNTTDDASIQSFFAWVDGKGSKGLDHLILSAGDTISFNLLAQTDTSALADPFQVRLFGIFRAVKAAQPLLNVGGSVTLTSGMSSRKPPGKGWALAGSIMGSVEALARSLAHELAPIRCNAICPGTVETEMWDTLVDDET